MPNLVEGSDIFLDCSVVLSPLGANILEVEAPDKCDERKFVLLYIRKSIFSRSISGTPIIDEDWVDILRFLLASVRFRFIYVIIVFRF